MEDFSDPDKWETENTNQKNISENIIFQNTVHEEDKEYDDLEIRPNTHQRFASHLI